MIRRTTLRGTPTTPDAMDELAAETGQTRARVLEEWGERAAIREYLGGMSLAEAERRAIDDVRAIFSSRQRSLF